MNKKEILSKLNDALYILEQVAGEDLTETKFEKLLDLKEELEEELEGGK